jgi:hypothetical protein
MDVKKESWNAERSNSNAWSEFPRIELAGGSSAPIIACRAFTPHHLFGMILPPDAAVKGTNAAEHLSQTQSPFSRLLFSLEQCKAGVS